MYIIFHPPHIIKKLFPKSLVWRIPTKEKIIYLTFDDGPVSGVTENLLHFLDQEKITATFFCVGDNIRKHFPLFEQVASKHCIGNHTFNHINGWKTSSKKYIQNVQQCNQYVHSNLFRPPYGKISPWQIIKLRKTHKIIMPSLLSRDFDHSLDCDFCLKKLIRFTKPGAIVVFHDNEKSKQRLFEILPAYIKHCKENGYRFEPLSTIFK